LAAIVAGKSKTKIQDNIAEKCIKLTWLKKRTAITKYWFSQRHDNLRFNSFNFLYYLVLFLIYNNLNSFNGQKKHQQSVKK
jgi:hypothetical protein